MIENQKEYGKFYTNGRPNPFKNEVFRQWYKEAKNNSNNKVILEPFAGHNHLIDYLKEIDNELSFDSYDIEPPAELINIVKKNDSFENFPIGYDIAITNPPYLSKGFAKRHSINFPKKIKEENLYLHSLVLLLNNCKYVAAIVPTNILKKHESFLRIKYYILLGSDMFIDTDTPTALVLFTPSENNDFEIYHFKKKIGKFRIIKEKTNKWLNDKNQSDDLKIVFNSKDGNIFLNAFDSTEKLNIYFGDKGEMNSEKIKVSSRQKTLIKVNRKITSKDIVCLNELILEYRKISKDLLMNTFMSARKDGEFRRRIDYKTVRKIIEKYFGEKND